MRLRIVYYRPAWHKLMISHPTEAQQNEAWRVMFEGEFVAPSQYEVVADVHTERGEATDGELLNDTFRNTQNDFFDKGWRQYLIPDADGIRSSMIGDLFAFDNRWYIVKREGFEQLTPEQITAAEAIR